MSESGDPTDRIKVVDRRRFTGTGELRPERAEAAAREPAGPSSADSDSAGQAQREEAATHPEPSAAGAARQAGLTSEAFLELVETLAHQAELFMTGAPGLPKQPEGARRLIDYLGVLETKTRGNLSAEESQILSSVIFQLRMRVVQSGP